VLTRPRAAAATSHPQIDVQAGAVRLRAIDLPPAATGADRPPLLLLHGHVSRLEEYEDLLVHLAGSRRVLVPDMPGTGYSDKPSVRYDLGYLEDTLIRFLDAARVPVVDVAGGSLGGNLSLRLSWRFPDRVRRVAAWSPAGVWRPAYRWVAFAWAMKQLPFMFWPSLWVQSRFWYAADHPGRDTLLERAFRYFREVDSREFRRAYWEVGGAQAGSSLFDVAGEIRKPVYLAYGSEDHALDIDRGTQHLATLLPDVRLDRYEGCGHALANERPERLALAVRAFLDG
jgi:pimeloyl-ACP methyl ester carboxylesterase